MQSHQSKSSYPLPERMDSKTASGLLALRIGRPTTIRLAPSPIASDALLERAWSSHRVPGGLTPGVTISAATPQADRSLLASYGLQTTPERPAFRANPERHPTVSFTPPFQPPARTASSLKLVNKVTPKTDVSLAAWVAAATIISSPPEAWTVRNRGVQWDTARTACPTVCGIS